MDGSLRTLTITELVSPYLSDDLFLVLWNAMATTRAHEKVDATDAPLQSETGTLQQDNDEEPLELGVSRKRASALANLVLQERVRLVFTVWHALSAEEQSVLLSTFQATEKREECGATKLTAVLRELEETYTTEQVHHHRLVTRRNLLVPSRPDEHLLSSSTGERLGAAHRRSTVMGRKRFMSSYALANHLELQRALPPVDASGGGNKANNQLISIPDVLFGMLSSRERQSSVQTRRLMATMENMSVDELKAELETVLHQCEEVFELLCDESEDTDDTVHGSRRGGPARLDEESSLSSHDTVPAEADSLSQAKRSLCDLLCLFTTPTEAIVEKLIKSEEARERLRRARQESEAFRGGTNALVQMIIQQQKQNPSLLVSAINQSPEVILSAVAHNLGILRFTITKFAGPVKRFLKLDPKACDHLDSLVQKNRGVQLLWGTNSSTVDTVLLGLDNAGGVDYLATAASDSLVTGGGGSYLVDWFTSHIADLVALFLRQPELLKELFTDIHQRADVSTFYRLMLQLQSTTGVQNFMRRASVATLERVAHEDPGEIVRLLREVFHEDAESGLNRDLLDQLRSSQYLVTCLSEFHPSALQDILSSHIDTWKHYFVDAAASNDGILRESLLLRVRCEQTSASASCVTTPCVYGN